ncbi:hypothetical protein GPJ56_001876 [Histomonas meleagridis]|uniref:uncharacterized protein n=1 Tax=Histomonas meleagridis TaxID=135588 RepID=UPI0035595A9B|nr:hypothetical protein GPJ56_001876 [Histomonas meleagridis]KAH0803185.1 hypothetical protein GO595_003921 [Histomonas meleagridis]
MHDKNLAKISELHSSDIETEVSFVKELQPLRIYSVTHGLYVISATVIPYFPTTRNESEKQKLACLFPSNLPEAVFPRYDDNALIQGIRALITKIDSSKAILDVDEEAPLELTKQKMMNEIQKMELQIKLKKEDLIYQMNDKQNPLMENIVKTVSISNSISDSINFNGQYSIPGTDVAAQIRKLAAEIPS